MTLLNSLAMFAAVAVIVPILIHLQKRRKSRVVDWPAMQFLKQTVTSRRRGLTLENLLLLLVRCLLVLLFVLAMARPAIESGRTLSWLLFSLFAGCGLLLLIATLVSPWTRRSRWTGVVVAALLFASAGAMLSASSESLVDSAADRDVAVVIDCSLTMTLGDDETTHFTTHFDRAISQARSLIETLSGNSTVSIVMAGPVSQTVDGSAFRNLRKAAQVLDTLEPVAGGSDLQSGIRMATSLLRNAPNTQKQILLLTDDQLCTWESIDQLRLAGPAFVADHGDSPPQSQIALTNEIKGHVHRSTVVPTVIDTVNLGANLGEDLGVNLGGDRRATYFSLDPKIACAAIVARLPRNADNVSINRLLVSASLVTANRPVPIDVQIRNGGSTTVQDVVVNLLVDGREAASERLVQIEPGVESTVQFLHTFPKAGQHVISATIATADQLPEDNRFDSVVDVIPHVSILLVNGSTESDATQQSVTFAQLALDPTSLRAPHRDGDPNIASDENPGRAIITTTIEAARMDDIESLENFQLVMLCDVPRLPIDAAKRIADFVEDGGGLWVIPGEHADVSFYNNWRGSLTDEPIIPAQMGERHAWVGQASADGRVSRLGIALDVAGDPLVSALFEHAGQDLADISVSRFRTTTPHASAIVGMQLTNGEPLFTEHAMGRGRVLMQSVSLAQRDSNFPANLGFPVLMHLWSYHLAACDGMPANFGPTSDLVTALTAGLDPAEGLERLRVIEPRGAQRTIPVSWEQDVALAHIGQVMVPGVYDLHSDQSEQSVSRFAIHRNHEESDLSVASAERMQEISHGLGMEFIDDASQFNSTAAVESVGTEIWDTLLFIVLWLLAAECLVTKWIRSRRNVASIASSASNDQRERKSLVSQFAASVETSGFWKDASVPDSAAVLEEAR